jgi:ABC-type branched-subunit amino acid transport system substrate-binding protein
MARLVFLMLFGFSLISTLPASGVPLATPGQEQNAAMEQQELQRAKYYLEAGRDDEALMVLRGFVVRYPSSPQVATANLWLAKIFYQRQQYQDARLYLERMPVTNRVDVKLLSGLLDVATGDVEAGMAELRALPDGELTTEDQLLRDKALAAAYQQLGQRLQALIYLHHLSQQLVDQQRQPVLQQAHELLSALEPAELDEAAFMLRGTAVGQDAGLQQARRTLAAGRKDLALSRVQAVVFDPTPFPYRAEATALLDRLTGQPWLQRAIGVLLPLSGRYAAFGSLVQRGMDLAQVLHNQSHAPVRLIYRDVGQGPDQAVAEVARLANEDRVMALAGPITGLSAEAAARRADQEQVPLIALSQRPGLPQIGPYAFRDSLTSRLQAKALARHAVVEQGLSSFAVLYPENRLGNEMAQMFAEEVLALGGLVIDRVSYPEDATDFRRQVKLLRGEDPDAPDDPPEMTEKDKLADLFQPDLPSVDFDGLFIPDYADKIGLIAPQLPFYGIEGVQLLGINGWNSPELIRNAGSSVEGAVFVDGFFRYSRYPFVQEFVDLFVERFGEEPSILEAQGFDVANILFSLLDRPDVTSRETLRLALALLQDYPGVTGATSFDQQGEAEKVLFLLQVQHGHIVQIN